MKRNFAVLLALAILFVFSNSLAQVGHTLQIDNGIGAYTIIKGSALGGTYIIPPGGGTFLTTGGGTTSGAWLLGGNTTVSSQSLGTISGQDLAIISNNVTRLTFKAGGAINIPGLSASQAVVTDGSNNLASLAYTSANTASTLVQRDGSGGIAGVAGSFTGAVNMNSNLINNVTDPVSAQDAATKAYVDSKAVPAGAVPICWGSVNANGTVNASYGCNIIGANSPYTIQFVPNVAYSTGAIIVSMGQYDLGVATGFFVPGNNQASVATYNIISAAAGFPAGFAGANHAFTFVFYGKP